MYKNYQTTENDCYRACIASLMDSRQVIDVPVCFVEGRRFNVAEQRDWLWKRHYTLIRVPLPASTMEEALTLSLSIAPYGHFIMSGATIKGVQHSVICQSGVVVFDPSRVPQPLVAPSFAGCFFAHFLGVRT